MIDRMIESRLPYASAAWRPPIFDKKTYMKPACPVASINAVFVARETAGCFERSAYGGATGNEDV
jgi:hypothetical protein